MRPAACLILAILATGCVHEVTQPEALPAGAGQDVFAKAWDPAVEKLLATPIGWRLCYRSVWRE